MKENRNHLPQNTQAGLRSSGQATEAKPEFTFNVGQNKCEMIHRRTINKTLPK